MHIVRPACSSTVSGLILSSSTGICLIIKYLKQNLKQEASLPSARSTTRSIICYSFAAQPVPIKICRRMVDSEPFLVTLANFGEDINPVLGLNTIIGLNVEHSFRLNHLEHLKGREGKTTDY